MLATIFLYHFKRSDPLGSVVYEIDKYLELIEYTTG